MVFQGDKKIIGKVITTFFMDVGRSLKECRNDVLYYYQIGIIYEDKTRICEQLKL